MGGSFIYERRLLRFISWLLETTNFKTVGKNEAIVDALGYVYVRPIRDRDIAYRILCIYILRGVILPLLVLLHRALVGL